MEMTFIFRRRQGIRTTESPFGLLTEARYRGGTVYLGPIDGDGRVAVVFKPGENPFVGYTTSIEPFGSEGIEKLHLRLTVEGEPLVSYN